MEKKTTNKLARKMFIAMLLGLLTGILFIFIRQNLVDESTWKQIYNLLFQDVTAADAPANALGLFYIIGQLFVNALQIIIVPMVFTSIVLAFCRISDTKKLGRITFKTIKMFLMTSVLALLTTSVIGMVLYNLNVFSISNIEGLEATAGATGSNPLSIVMSVIPNNLVTAFSSNSRVLAIVFIAVSIGLSIHALKDKITVFNKICEEIHHIITVFLSFVINKFGPIGIFVLLTRTFAIYGINYLIPALVYVIVCIVTLFLFLIVIYPSIVYLYTKLSPKTFIRKMLKVAVFAFSTSSSAATLPLNLNTSINELGIDEEVSSFALPLGMTVNMDGTAIMQVIATIFIASCAGYELTFMNILVIATLTLVASIGTPAAPGAGAVILFTVLSGMGYTSDTALLAYALILAINRPIEMLVTSLNVVGDTTAALVVAHSENLLDKEIYNS